MSDKLARAQHRRAPEQNGAHRANETQSAQPRTWEAGETGRIPVIGKHAGTDKAAELDARRERQALMRSAAPGETSSIPIVSKHAGADKTLAASSDARANAFGRTSAQTGNTVRTPAPAPDVTIVGEEPESKASSVGASAALMSVCVLFSRITGFLRTWAMAFALGSSFLSSSYQVANNLPNMLYELVMGGMLVTAFLPVYISVKKKSGTKAGNAYASNLLTLVTIFLGVLSVLCMIFPAQVIYTQTFYSDQSSSALATFFFQYFAIQLVFYGASSIVSGLLNANRDYLWSSIAPVANNVIVIATFLMYAAIAPINSDAALFVIAIGNPLGVFVQMAIQLPALKRNGIRLRPRIDLHDPALRDTLAIGGPTFLVMIISFATVSVMNAASYCFAVDGPSILAYSRLWYTLPYSFLAIPITTAMFTELSEMKAEGDMKGVVSAITNGTAQIMFLLVPFALYLAVFSVPLVTLYHVGAFTMENIQSISSYLVVLAFALPFYGVSSYLQKVFSSLRKMGVYAALNFLAGIVQVALTAFWAWTTYNGDPNPATIES
ncbi:murein biosynthesis integral membrane protein MurJ, partial [Ellagibacter isourolithinifaciens]|uniref:murein biosynthesis integral membrane protein MurJ n=1 Tax=Ellagibacter isourolithinifaciens TaxID=2137581 RepID=UPI0023F4D498